MNKNMKLKKQKMGYFFKEINAVFVVPQNLGL